MAFKDFQPPEQGVQLLQRSLARGRLAHAYLFTGPQLEGLETLARTLAKTVNCQHQTFSATDNSVTDCCDACLSCRKIEAENHGDIHWVRPESKSRVITIDQIRELNREIHLKSNEAVHKVAVIVAADRLNPQAANAFLKTLEEPPPKTVLILLTTDPSRLLETIRSRCLRLNFGDGRRLPEGASQKWLAEFSALATAGHQSLLNRYRMLDALLRQLAEAKEEVAQHLTERSPLTRYPETDEDLRKKWETELTAAIEEEYRRRRNELLLLVEWWLRDVWLRTLRSGEECLAFPQLTGTADLAQRLTTEQALENVRLFEDTQQLLYNTSIPEALVLEVALLKLHL